MGCNRLSADFLRQGDRKKYEEENQLRCLLKGKFIYRICFGREDFFVLLCMQSTCKLSCKGIKLLVFSLNYLIREPMIKKPFNFRGIKKT